MTGIQNVDEIKLQATKVFAKAGLDNQTSG
jgi:hypothetical protein